MESRDSAHSVNNKESISSEEDFKNDRTSKDFPEISPNNRETKDISGATDLPDEELDIIQADIEVLEYGAAIFREIRK
jgi:hypothetical protein